MLTRMAAALLLAAWAWFATGSNARSAKPEAGTLPFVGCPSDGQSGPVEAPHAPQILPEVPPREAASLALYQSAAQAMVGPQGWHCVGLYGSDGSVLLITPAAHVPSEFFAENAALTGPAIEVTRSIADTSGRFEAARIAARLFPARRAFVQSVIDEGIEAADQFPFGPYRTDAVLRQSPSAVEFLTPAGKPGMGTMGRMTPGADPIHGLALMARGNDTTLVNVRLPAGQTRLAETIIRIASGQKPR